MPSLLPNWRRELGLDLGLGLGDTGYDWETGTLPWQRDLPGFQRDDEEDEEDILEKLRKRREERIAAELEDRDIPEDHPLRSEWRSHLEARERAEALGIEGDGRESGGLLSTLASGLDAARAGVFAGLEEAGSFLTPGGDSASLGNLRENFNQRKGVGDTELLRFRDDDSGWMRALKATGAFAGDVAMDPLTYVSLGGSVLGRKGAAEAAEAVGRNLAPRALAGVGDDALREAASRVHPERIAQALSTVTGVPAGELLAQGTDELLELAARQGVLRSIADEGFAAGLAESVATRGSRGARGFLDEFADGDELFRSLPADLQGGARLRIPFKRDAAGLPFAKQLPGTGGGKALDAVPGLGGLARLGNEARAAVRASGMGRIVDRGRYGALYGQMIRDVYQRPDDIAGVGWSRYAAMREADRETRRWLRGFDDATHGAVLHSRRLLDQAEDTEAAEESFRRFFLDREATQAIDPETLDDATMAAHQAASVLHGLVDDVGVQMKSLFGDDVGWINHYVPRIATEQEKLRRKATVRAGSRRAGSKADPMKTRRQYVDEFVLTDDGRLSPRWMTPDAANEATGRAVFETEPLRVVAEYTQVMRNVLRQERLMRALESNGLLTSTGVRDVRTLARDKVAGAAGGAIPSVRAGIEALRTGDRDTLVSALRGLGRDPDELPVTRWWPSESRVAGRWESVDGVVIEKGKGKNPWVATLPGGTQSPKFGTLREARAFADEQMDRGRLGTQRMEAMERLVDDEARLTEALDPKNLPTDADELDAYLSDLADTVGRYSASRPRKADFYDTTAIKDRVAKWMQEQGFEEVADDPTLKRAIAARLDREGAFAAPAVKDAMVKMWRVRQGGELQSFIDGFWQPYFTAWKTWATVGRGPGFVMRNVVGGAWNAHLYDVKAAHFAEATVAHRLWKAARAEAEKIGDDPIEQGQRAMALFREQMERRGERWKRVADSWESFLDNGLTERETTRSLGELETSGFFDASSMGVRGRGQQGLFPDLRPDELSAPQRVANRTVDNRWIRFMSARAEGSESWLRFASFLKGADEWGLEDGGVAASMAVKATQFDYADLSDFERQVLKNVVPFYTWARNNVPLQFRALMTEPGKINRLMRVNEQAQRLLGADPEDPDAGHALPEWVRERMGWVSKFSYGDAPITIGVESPVTDLNRWLQKPEGLNPVSAVRGREVLNSLSPVFKVFAETATGSSTFTGGRLPAEDAPPWARLVPGATEPGGEGDPRILNLVRQGVPPLALAERLLGSTDRYDERLLTSWMSALLAAPVSTLNTRQEAAELRERTKRLNTEADLRDPASRELADTLIEAGWDPDRIREYLATA